MSSPSFYITFIWQMLLSKATYNIIS
uniref:Uncharacterized protein n=1 Tax=Anguilla anguilla TaxID=7936 RepID=A0A0E9PN08_ANGAN